MDQSREKKVTLNLEEVSSAPGIHGPAGTIPQTIGKYCLSKNPQSLDFKLRIKQKKIQIRNANNGEELVSSSIHQMRKMQF